jgi:predicted ATP-binding protein involved in virulence
MKITDLKIQNFRLFKNLTINFHPQLTILVANNGGGKTTILDAIYNSYPKNLTITDKNIVGIIDNTNIKAEFNQCPSTVSIKNTDKLRYYDSTRQAMFYRQHLVGKQTSSITCNILSSFFKGTDWEDITYVNEIMINHKNIGILPITLFGNGICSLFNILIDIIHISYDLATSNFNGVVLIDNIELHLHPKLQQTILKRFTDTFPLIQFIVTTHSPQVLSTVRKENIRVIEAIGEIGDGIYEANMPEFSPLAHRSDDALARIMDVSPAPNLFEDDLGQYQQYVKHNQENTEKAIAIRKKLDDAGYEFHESDLSSWRFIASRKLNKRG